MFWTSQFYIPPCCLLYSFLCFFMEMKSNTNTHFHFLPFLKEKITACALSCTLFFFSPCILCVFLYQYIKSTLILFYSFLPLYWTYYSLFNKMILKEI